MDQPPLDHGSDRYGYIEVSGVGADLPDPPAKLIERARCGDCLSNLFFRWDGERWTWTVAHDDSCPFLEREGDR